MHFIYTITLLLFVQCSLQKIIKNENRIKINVEKAPYEVGLRIKWTNSTVLCGGSLIKRSFVLTAASCFPEDVDDIISLSIYIGTKSLYHKDCNKPTAKAKRIITFNDLDSNLKSKDIALVELRKPVKLSNKIAVVQLSTISDVNLLKGKIGSVSGLDLLAETSDSNKRYRKVKVRIGSMSRAKNRKIPDSSRILGVSAVKSRKQCYCGLLGSPLMLGNTNTQIGVSTVQVPQIHQGSTVDTNTNRPNPNTQIGVSSVQGSVIYQSNSGNTIANVGPNGNVQISSNSVKGQSIYQGNTGNIYIRGRSYPNQGNGVSSFRQIYQSNSGNIVTSIGPYGNIQYGGYPFYQQGPTIYQGHTGSIFTNVGAIPSTQQGNTGNIYTNGGQSENKQNGSSSVQCPQIYQDNTGNIYTNVAPNPNTLNGDLSFQCPQSYEGDTGYIFTNIEPYLNWVNTVSPISNRSNKLVIEVATRP